jgi:hypothetical protein
MLTYEELNQINDTFHHEASAGLLFIGRRISALSSGSEYP